MKQAILVFVFTLLIGIYTINAQQFQMIPMHPQSGESITITYDPSGGNLEGKQVNAIAYVMEFGELPAAFDVPMAKSDNGYTGTFQTPANAQAVLVKFENQDGSKSDNNDDKGYFSMMYKDGKPVSDAPAAASTAYSSYARMLGVKSDKAKAKECFEMVVANDPAQKMHVDYISQYTTIVRLNKDEAAKAKLLEHVNKVVANKKSTEEELIKMAGVARTLKEKDLNTSITEQIKTKFPKGKTATSALFRAFYDLKELDQKEAKFKELKAAYGDQEDYKKSFENMARSLAVGHGNAGNFDAVKKYVGMISSGNTIAGIYNSLAWKMSGESIEGEATNLDYALKISKKSLELLEAEMEAGADKPSYYSANQWKRSMLYSYGQNADTYALVAYKAGNLKDAVKYQQKACEASKFASIELNERHAIYLEKDQGAKASMAFLEKMIVDGHANSAMKGQFEKLFKANVSIDDASAMYLTMLEKKAKEHKIQEIKENMMDDVAPVFALTNLKGQEVSLESLKGKVVIVDFWATWCGPCKASFPAMQKAVDKYADVDDVEFIFVDTWEKGEKKEENAQKFIDGKGYTFNVLMDNKDKMVADYEVSGIPTKFILDKDGKIRFRSSGFNGNDDELVDEISIVVEILRGNAGGAISTGTQP